MLKNPEDLFSVNKNSIKYLFDIILSQREGYRPTTSSVLKELMEIELKEIPFEGTITERNKFIEDTMTNLIKEYVKEGKLEITDKDEEGETISE